MALAADFARLRPGLQLQRVRIVAIRASHTRLVHATLYKRAIHIDLVENLPVIKIQRRVQQRGSVCFCQRHAIFVIVDQHTAPRMAAAARFRLFRLPHRQFGALSDARVDIHLPHRPAVIVQIDLESPATRNLTRIRRSYMHRAWPVTGLAADIDLRPGCRETIARLIVVDLQVLYAGNERAF